MREISKVVIREVVMSDMLKYVQTLNQDLEISNLPNQRSYLFHQSHRRFHTVQTISTPLRTVIEKGVLTQQKSQH